MWIIKWNGKYQTHKCFSYGKYCSVNDISKIHHDKNRTQNMLKCFGVYKIKNNKNMLKVEIGNWLILREDSRLQVEAFMSSVMGRECLTYKMP